MRMFDLIISLVMLAAILLLGGAALLLRKGEGKRAALMFVLALVMLANAAIWLIPDENGDSPLQQAATIAEQ